MIKLIKYQLIAFAVALFIGLCLGGWRIHPDAMTEKERRAAGYFEIGTIDLDIDDLEYR